MSTGTDVERRPNRRHWAVLLLSVGVVLAAFCLRVLPAGRVAVRGWEHRPLPHVCGMRILFGTNCPVCGLTRSAIHLVNGRWPDAYGAHRLGWLVGIAIVLQIPYRMFALCSRKRVPIGKRLPAVLGWGLAGVFAVNWLVGFAM